MYVLLGTSTYVPFAGADAAFTDWRVRFGLLILVLPVVLLVVLSSCEGPVVINAKDAPPAQPAFWRSRVYFGFCSYSKRKVSEKVSVELRGNLKGSREADSSCVSQNSLLAFHANVHLHTNLK